MNGASAVPPFPPLPASWGRGLAAERDAPYFAQLERFVAAERERHVILPAPTDVFRALELTSFRRLAVLILGQDPYATPGLAHGLAFSVLPGVTPPPSLRNIYRELHDDLGVPIPAHGHLEAWARRGVLLLNAVLTVRAGEPNSHAGVGWEQFTDAVIRRAGAKRNRVVFVLWGNYAQKKAPLIDTTRHVIVTGAHPSPLSAKRGFFGSRPFSAINRALSEAGRPPIDWRLPPI